MKITIVYQRPTRGVSCNQYPQGGIEVSKDVRTEGLHEVGFGTVTEMTHVFRLPGNGEYELEVTPHNMEWFKKASVDRTLECGKVIPASFKLKWEQQMQYVNQFDPPTPVEKLVEEAIFTKVEDAPMAKKKGRPARAVAKPKVDVATPIGADA